MPPWLELLTSHFTVDSRLLKVLVIQTFELLWLRFIEQESCIISSLITFTQHGYPKNLSKHHQMNELADFESTVQGITKRKDGQR